MAVNRYTAKLIIAQAEKTYYSRNGNSYKAIKVFDKKKNFRILIFLCLCLIKKIGHMEMQFIKK